MCPRNLCLTIALLSLLLCRFVISSKKENKGFVPCVTDDDCSHLSNSTCVQPICMCNGSRICTLKVIKVVTKIGEKCETSEECNIESAECRKFKCECRDGYVKSADGRKCLIVSEGINGSCEASIQCYTKVPDSVCRNNKCVCEGKHEYKGLCYRNAELGQSCQSDPECSLNKFSKCLKSVCSCDAGYVASINGSICLFAAEGNNSPCVDGLQCTTTLGEYSHCVDGVCKCKELYHYKEKINKCIEDVFLGDICIVHSDCHDPYQEKEKRLECIAGVCACRSFLTEKKGICIDSSSSKVSAAPLFLFIIYVVRKLLN